jgi:uncharacterized membrane protein
MREIMLIIHFIGLAMGLGTSFGHMFLGIASKKLPKDEATKFLFHTMALSKMGHIVLVLLFVSGGALMTPYWSMLPSSPLLMLKLFLFLVVCALVGIISSTGKKAKSGNAEVHLKQIETLGKITFPTILIIVILAVYIFH